MMESNGTTIQYVFFIKIITEAQAQIGGRRPDGTITFTQTIPLSQQTFTTPNGALVTWNGHVVSEKVGRGLTRSRSSTNCPS